jgi:DNA polymerase V
MDAVDNITNTYGRRSITLAKSWTVDGWQMKRGYLSPNVTTDINVVPAVK